MSVNYLSWSLPEIIFLINFKNTKILKKKKISSFVLKDIKLPLASIYLKGTYFKSYTLYNLLYIVPKAPTLYTWIISKWGNKSILVTNLLDIS